MQLELPYHLENYIDGYFIGPLSGQFLPNINPATGEVYGQLPASNDRDVELAYRAAQKAFVGWSNTPATERFAILNRIADLIDEHLAVLALAETNDSGKPLWLSKAVDIPRASANIRFFATGILHFASESHAMEGMGINYTLRQPIGVVGCISPWNLPLYLFTWKIAPALAAGNCVVAKPSEVTPATAFLLGKLCQAAGLPGGVLNIVHGTGPDCGEAIVRHPGIKAISFTGSTRAGERIAGIAAPLFKKLSLELGGKNPALIFADCNWERMLQETVRAAFSNQGQICLCTSNLLIERRIYDRFREAFVERAKQLTVGDPLEDGVRQGALVGEAHFNKVMACIETARQEGGTLLCGGLPVTLEGRCAKGWFVQPTVLEGLDGNSQTCQQEIFGPVVTLRPFDTMEEALAMANANQYGLAATVWTQDLNKAHQAAQQLQCGIVWVNCWLLRDLRTPFGGVKNSGVGREGGWEALRFFTEPKNVCVRY